MKVHISGQARSYLRAEAAYLRRHSPAAAPAFLARMAEARKNLGRFSEMGFDSESLPVPGSHRLVIGDYVLDYDIDDEGVVIIAIRHGRQNLVSAAIEDDFDYETPEED